MKRNKIFISCLGILLFFIIFIGSFTLWKEKWKYSNAENGTTEIADMRTNKEQKLLTINTTFYNYRYDREISNGKRDQGAQSCYDDGGIPFETFDGELSNYYKDHKVKVGIYTGNFYMYYGGLEGVGDKKKPFPGYYNFRWPANIANRNTPYDSVCQGIVADELSGFSEGDSSSGTLMAKTDSGQVAVPYFDKEFLAKIASEKTVAIGAVKENVGFPFRQITSGDKEGYYEFDSTKDVVRFKDMWNQAQDSPAKDEYYFGKEGILEYYHEAQFVKSRAEGDTPQFLPYNKPGASQESLDYGFGVRFNIPFYLSEDGTVDGNNMVFEFSGDDDVWIFLDGKLVLDLGGQHGKATGTIDFGGEDETAKVINQKVTFAKGSTNAAETVFSDKILAEDTYVKNKITTVNSIKKGNKNKHVLTIFYMERGMFESNFHMAFNFVPEGAPLPTTTPEPSNEPTPEPSGIQDGSLTIQNKMVFPTEQNAINAAFQEVVKNMAEDDIFQYSIQNKGTKAEHVGDSEIKYPSGKLTVRENGSATIGKKKSYLSFGARPVEMVRVYFDLNSAKNLKSDDGSKNWGGASKTPYFEIGGNRTKMTVYEGNIYYADTKIGNSIKFANGPNGGCATNDQYISLNKDGTLFKASSLGNNGELSGAWTNSIYPALNTGDSVKRYSKDLPYQNAGTDEKNFTPADDTNFNNISEVAYKLVEAYPAPTNNHILINEELTSGITNENGLFGLFYNDSATFQRQFATGSTMKVVQESTLWTPERYSGVLSTETNADDALTKFVTPAKERKTADYYYTTVKAESKSADGTKTVPVNVSYNGQYSFLNGTNIPSNDPVNITQTFTNTIKTGSLTISKELKGNMDVDSNHSYKFRVTFSKVFGGNSEEKVYTGSYTLAGKDGTPTSKSQNTNNGFIVLQPGQKAVISGIPVGTAYKIEELGEDGKSVSDGSVVREIQTTYIADQSITSTDYKTTDTTAGIMVDEAARTISGVIPCSVVDKLYERETNKFSEVNVSITYTNQFGAISITKKISGDVNNSSYYGTKDDGTSKVTYTFSVIDESVNAPYSGEYLLYTYKYENGINMPPTVTEESKSTMDGTIQLKEGQKAEIGGISLSSDHRYRITEDVKDEDIFFVQEIKVTEGNKDDQASTTNNSITAVLNSTSSAFDVVYNNRYSNAYIKIEKFVDKVYYDGKEYSSGLTYQELTSAKQSFIFKVKQYKTLQDAEAGNETYESSFEFVLSMGGRETELLDTPISFRETSFPYKLSQTIQVLGNRYYRIEEETDWSWKYKLTGMDFEDSNENVSSKKSENAIILKGYLDSENEIEKKKIPIAKFYNCLDSAKEHIDGDTDDVINKIESSTQNES